MHGTCVGDRVLVSRTDNSTDYCDEEQIQNETGPSFSTPKSSAVADSVDSICHRAKRYYHRRRQVQQKFDFIVLPGVGEEGDSGDRSPFCPPFLAVICRLPSARRRPLIETFLWSAPLPETSISQDTKDLPFGDERFGLPVNIKDLRVTYSETPGIPELHVCRELLSAARQSPRPISCRPDNWNPEGISSSLPNSNRDAIGLKKSASETFTSLLHQPSIVEFKEKEIQANPRLTGSQRATSLSEQLFNLRFHLASGDFKSSNQWVGRDIKKPCTSWFDIKTPSRTMEMSLTTDRSSSPGFVATPTDEQDSQTTNLDIDPAYLVALEFARSHGYGVVEFVDDQRPPSPRTTRSRRASARMRKSSRAQRTSSGASVPSLRQAFPGQVPSEPKNPVHVVKQPPKPRRRVNKCVARPSLVRAKILDELDVFESAREDIAKVREILDDMSLNQILCPIKPCGSHSPRRPPHQRRKQFQQSSGTSSPERTSVTSESRVPSEDEEDIIRSAPLDKYMELLSNKCQKIYQEPSHTQNESTLVSPHTSASNYDVDNDENDEAMSVKTLDLAQSSSAGIYPPCLDCNSSQTTLQWRHPPQDHHHELAMIGSECSMVGLGKQKVVGKNSIQSPAHPSQWAYPVSNGKDTGVNSCPETRRPLETSEHFGCDKQIKVSEDTVLTSPVDVVRAGTQGLTTHPRLKDKSSLEYRLSNSISATMFREMLLHSKTGALGVDSANVSNVEVVRIANEVEPPEEEDGSSRVSSGDTFFQQTTCKSRHQHQTRHSSHKVCNNAPCVARVRCQHKPAHHHHLHHHPQQQSHAMHSRDVRKSGCHLRRDSDKTFSCPNLATQHLVGNRKSRIEAPRYSPSGLDDKPTVSADQGDSIESADNGLSKTHQRKSPARGDCVPELASDHDVNKKESPCSLSGLRLSRDSVITAAAECSDATVGELAGAGRATARHRKGHISVGLTSRCLGFNAPTTGNSVSEEKLCGNNNHQTDTGNSTRYVGEEATTDPEEKDDGDDSQIISASQIGKYGDANNNSLPTVRNSLDRSRNMSTCRAEKHCSPLGGVRYSIRKGEESPPRCQKNGVGDERSLRLPSLHLSSPRAASQSSPAARRTDWKETLDVPPRIQCKKKMKQMTLKKGTRQSAISESFRQNGTLTVSDTVVSDLLVKSRQTLQPVSPRPYQVNDRRRHCILPINVPQALTSSAVRLKHAIRDRSIEEPKPEEGSLNKSYVISKDSQGVHADVGEITNIKIVDTNHTSFMISDQILPTTSLQNNMPEQCAMPLSLQSFLQVPKPQRSCWSPQLTSKYCFRDKMREENYLHEDIEKPINVSSASCSAGEQNDAHGPKSRTLNSSNTIVCRNGIAQGISQLEEGNCNNNSPRDKRESCTVSAHHLTLTHGNSRLVFYPRTDSVQTFVESDRGSMTAMDVSRDFDTQFRIHTSKLQRKKEIDRHSNAFSDDVNFSCANRQRCVEIPINQSSSDTSSRTRGSSDDHLEQELLSLLWCDHCTSSQEIQRGSCPNEATLTTPPNPNLNTSHTIKWKRSSTRPRGRGPVKTVRFLQNETFIPTRRTCRDPSLREVTGSCEHQSCSYQEKDSDSDSIQANPTEHRKEQTRLSSPYSPRLSQRSCMVKIRNSSIDADEQGNYDGERQTVSMTSLPCVESRNHKLRNPYTDGIFNNGIPYCPTTENYWDVSVQNPITRSLYSENADNTEHAFDNDKCPVNRRGTITSGHSSAIFDHQRHNTYTLGKNQHHNSISCCAEAMDDEDVNKEGDSGKYKHANTPTTLNSDPHEHISTLYKFLGSQLEKSHNEIGQRLDSLRDQVSSRLNALHKLMQDKVKLPSGMAETSSATEELRIHGLCNEKITRHQNWADSRLESEKNTISLNTTQSQSASPAYGFPLHISKCYNRQSQSSPLMRHLSENPTPDITPSADGKSFPQIDFAEVTAITDIDGPAVQSIVSTSSQVNSANISTGPCSCSEDETRPQIGHGNSGAHARRRKDYAKTRNVTPTYKSMRQWRQEVNASVYGTADSGTGLASGILNFRRNAHSRTCRRRVGIKGSCFCNTCLPGNKLRRKKDNIPRRSRITQRATTRKKSRNSRSTKKTPVSIFNRRSKTPRKYQKRKSILRNSRGRQGRSWLRDKKKIVRFKVRSRKNSRRLKPRLRSPQMCIPRKVLRKAKTERGIYSKKQRNFSNSTIRYNKSSNRNMSRHVKQISDKTFPQRAKRLTTLKIGKLKRTIKETRIRGKPQRQRRQFKAERYTISTKGYATLYKRLKAKHRILLRQQDCTTTSAKQRPRSLARMSLGETRDKLTRRFRHAISHFPAQRLITLERVLSPTRPSTSKMNGSFCKVSRRSSTCPPPCCIRPRIGSITHAETKLESNESDFNLYQSHTWEPTTAWNGPSNLTDKHMLICQAEGRNVGKSVNCRRHKSSHATQVSYRPQQTAGRPGFNFYPTERSPKQERNAIERDEPAIDNNKQQVRHVNSLELIRRRRGKCKDLSRNACSAHQKNLWRGNTITTMHLAKGDGRKTRFTDKLHRALCTLKMQRPKRSVADVSCLPILSHRKWPPRGVETLAGFRPAATKTDLKPSLERYFASEREGYQLSNAIIQAACSDTIVVRTQERRRRSTCSDHEFAQNPNENHICSKTDAIMYTPNSHKEEISCVQEPLLTDDLAITDANLANGENIRNSSKTRQRRNVFLVSPLNCVSESRNTLNTVDNNVSILHDINGPINSLSVVVPNVNAAQKVTGSINSINTSVSNMNPAQKGYGYTTIKITNPISHVSREASTVMDSARSSCHTQISPSNMCAQTFSQVHSRAFDQPLELTFNGAISSESRNKSRDSQHYLSQNSISSRMLKLGQETHDETSKHKETRRGHHSLKIKTSSLWDGFKTQLFLAKCKDKSSLVFGRDKSPGKNPAKGQLSIDKATSSSNSGEHLFQVKNKSSVDLVDNCSGRHTLNLDLDRAQKCLPIINAEQGEKLKTCVSKLCKESPPSSYPSYNEGKVAGRPTIPKTPYPTSRDIRPKQLNSNDDMKTMPTLVLRYNPTTDSKKSLHNLHEEKNGKLIQSFPTPDAGEFVGQYAPVKDSPEVSTGNIGPLQAERYDFHGTKASVAARNIVVTHMGSVNIGHDGKGAESETVCAVDSKKPTDHTFEMNSNQPIDHTCEMNSTQPTDHTCEMNSNQPIDQTCEMNSNQPTDHTCEMNSNQPTDHTCEMNSNQRIDHTCEMNSNQPTDHMCKMNSNQPIDHTCEMNSNQPTDHTCEMNSNQPIDPTCEMNSNQSTDHTCEMNSNQPIDQTCEMNSNQPIDPMCEMNSNQPTDHTCEINSNQPIDHTCEMNSNQPTDHTCEMNSNQPIDPTCEMNSNQPIDHTCEMNSNQPIDQTCEMNSNQPIDQTCEMNSNQPIDPMCEMNSNQPTDHTCEINSNQPIDHTCEMNSNQPTDHTCEMNSNQPIDPTCEMNSNQPIDHTCEMNSNQPIDPMCEMNSNQPTDHTCEINSNQPIDHTCEMNSNQPTDHTCEMNSNQPIDPTCEMNSNQPIDHTCEINSNQPIDHTCEMNSNQPTDHTCEMNSNQPIDHTCEINSNQPIDHTCEMNSNQPTDHTCEMNSNQPIDHTCEMNSNQPIDHTCEMNSNQPTDHTCEMNSNQSTDHTCEMNSNQPTDHTCEMNSNQSTDHTCEMNSDQPTDHTCEMNSQQHSSHQPWMFQHPYLIVNTPGLSTTWTTSNFLHRSCYPSSSKQHLNGSLSLPEDGTSSARGKREMGRNITSPFRPQTLTCAGEVCEPISNDTVGDVSTLGEAPIDNSRSKSIEQGMSLFPEAVLHEQQQLSPSASPSDSVGEMERPEASSHAANCCGRHETAVGLNQDEERSFPTGSGIGFCSSKSRSESRTSLRDVSDAPSGIHFTDVPGPHLRATCFPCVTSFADKFAQSSDYCNFAKNNHSCMGLQIASPFVYNSSQNDNGEHDEVDEKNCSDRSHHDKEQESAGTGKENNTGHWKSRTSSRSNSPDSDLSSLVGNNNNAVVSDPPLQNNCEHHRLRKDTEEKPDRALYSLHEAKRLALHQSGEETTYYTDGPQQIRFSLLAGSCSANRCQSPLKTTSFSLGGPTSSVWSVKERNTLPHRRKRRAISNSMAPPSKVPKLGLNMLLEESMASQRRWLAQRRFKSRSLRQHHLPKAPNVKSSGAFRKGKRRLKLKSNLSCNASDADDELST